MKTKKLGTGARYNSSKNKLGLISPWANAQLGRVLTHGAVKYDPRNWENGMSWSGVVDSLERHLAAYKAGEDFDVETGEFHMAHVMANSMFLTEYYRIYPQGDDRPKWWLSLPPITCDVDEVFADFTKAYSIRFDVPHPFHSWHFDPLLSERMEILAKDKDFWLNLRPLFMPQDLFFEPAGYVSARPIPEEWTFDWMEKWGFPLTPVKHVTQELDKVALIKRLGGEIHIDDAWHHYKAVSEAGIFCFLMDQPHNRRYDVGHHRITSIHELKERLSGTITPIKTSNEYSSN